MINSQLLTENDIQKVTSTVVDGQQLGALGRGRDGSIYVYAKAGGTVGKGKVVAAAANVANHLGITPATAAAGVTEITATLGATAATQNQYAGGTLVVDEGTGAGQTVKIKGNSAAGSAGVITLYLERPLMAALASGDSKVSLYPNKYNGVTISATVALKRVGVAVNDLASGDYGWLQLSGACGVLVDGSAVAIADPVIPGSVAGSVAGIGSVAATDQVLGHALKAGTDTKYTLVDLCITP